MVNVAIAGIAVTCIRSTGEHVPTIISCPSIPQLLVPVMGSEDVQNMLKFTCTLCVCVCVCDAARRAQARACVCRGPRLTIVFMTFSVLAQGGGDFIVINKSAPVQCRREPTVLWMSFVAIGVWRTY